jgi:Tetratricopeptide repeat
VLRWLTALVLMLFAGCQTAQTVTPTPVPTAAAAPPVVTAGRVDVLNQANTAFARRDYATASGLYERVVNTPPAGETVPVTSAIDGYARFRDAVALLQQGREDDAKAQVDALQQADANAPLARLAAQLWEQYGMIGELRGACAQIQPQIASQAGPTLAALQSAGVSVDPETLCS